MRCEVCGSVIPEGAPRCMVCGMPSPIGDSAAPRALRRGAHFAAPRDEDLCDYEDDFGDEDLDDYYGDFDGSASFDRPIQSPRPSNLKSVIIAVVAVVAVVVLCAGGYALYTTFIKSPAATITDDLTARLEAYADPATEEGTTLIGRADMMAAMLGMTERPGRDAYAFWLAESSAEVTSVDLADDDQSAQATVAITHPPLRAYLEEAMGVRPDAGDDEEVTVEVTYTRDGGSWVTDGEALEQAIFAGYLPDDEDLIRALLDQYFGGDDDIVSQFVEGVETSSEGGFEEMGITSAEFSEAYLEGFGYKVEAVTVSGDTATADISITVKSLNGIWAAYGEAFDAWASSDEAFSVTSEEEVFHESGRMLMEAAHEAEPQTISVPFTFTKDELGAWMIDATSQEAVVNALSAM